MPESITAMPIDGRARPVRTIADEPRTPSVENKFV